MTVFRWVLGSDIFVFREDWNRDIDNGRYFSDLYPEFRNSEFWREWLKYASACLETGLHYLTGIIINISYVFRRA